MIGRLLAVAVLVSLCAGPAAAQTDGVAQPDVRSYGPRASAPPGYPAGYAEIVRAGEDEGELVIYGATDEDAVRPLIADFQSIYPRIRVTYEDLNTTVLYHRFIAETRMGRDTGDVLWSSATDQMLSLASEGYAMTYVSPEKAGLPDWASWRDQAFATNQEPILIVYNKDLLKESEVPRTRADLVRLLESDQARFKGRVVTYDIEKSGVGFLLATQDEAVSGEVAALFKAFGRAEVALGLTTGAMAERVSSGRAILGYNLLGGYVASLASRRPSLGYIAPRDYTLVSSRVMVLNRNAAHPNAAKLWLDYLLSKRGQDILGTQSGLLAIRADAAAGPAMAQLRDALGPDRRPISLSPALLDGLGPRTYRDVVLRWRQAVFPERGR